MNEGSEKRINILRRTAKEVRNYKVSMKILTAALILLTILTGTLYAVSALYKKTGTFTVSVNKFEMAEYGLTLSEYDNMKYNTSHLNAEIAENITNISEDSIPENVDAINGSHNGDNYIAYTFYLQNAGEKNLTYPYEYSININNVTQNLDDAIRIRLYVDGKPTTYAKVKNDGSGPEPGTVSFSGANEVMRGRTDEFAPGAKTKFTIVMWIEGNDPECVDWLIGGQMKVSMKFDVVH